MNGKLLLIAAAFTLTACATEVTAGQQMAAVKNRASYDLNCDVEKLEVKYLQSNTYGASGCKKQQVYVTEGLQVYKEGMAPARNYYYDRSPAFGLGVGVGHYHGRYYR